jgi:hypothetical protein
MNRIKFQPARQQPSSEITSTSNADRIHRVLKELGQEHRIADLGKKLDALNPTQANPACLYDIWVQNRIPRAIILYAYKPGTACIEMMWGGTVKELGSGCREVQAGIWIPIEGILTSEESRKLDLADGIIPDDFDVHNLLLVDKETKGLLYGHALVASRSEMENPPEAVVIEIPAEAYIALLEVRFPNVPAVRRYKKESDRTGELFPGSTPELFADIERSIKLTHYHVRAMLDSLERCADNWSNPLTNS